MSQQEQLGADVSDDDNFDLESLTTALQQRVWQGKIPVKISLAANESKSFTNTLPLHVGLFFYVCWLLRSNCRESFICLVSSISLSISSSMSWSMSNQMRRYIVTHGFLLKMRRWNGIYVQPFSLTFEGNGLLVYYSIYIQPMTPPHWVIQHRHILIFHGHWPFISKITQKTSLHAVNLPNLLKMSGLTIWKKYLSWIKQTKL